jgi:hypothetical protein
MENNKTTLHRGKNIFSFELNVTAIPFWEAHPEPRA